MEVRGNSEIVSMSPCQRHRHTPFSVSWRVIQSWS